MSLSGVDPKQQNDSRPAQEVFSDAALDAMQRAVERAVDEHHRLGNPVAIWRDGRVVMLYPDGSTRPVEETAPR